MPLQILARIVALVVPLLVAAPALALEPPSLVQALTTTANAQLGVPYAYGGTTRRGFDCSGLVQYVYAKASVELPRTADAQFAFGTPVSLERARPGDLLFFNTGKPHGGVTHVGIYMGKNHFLHAPRTGRRVQYAELSAHSWFRPRLLGIRHLGGEVYALASMSRGRAPHSLPAARAFGIAQPDAKAWLASRQVTRIASARYD